MGSWLKSVWSRRLLVAVVLASAWPVYRAVSSRQEANRAAQEERIAQVTAVVWVASARFRDQPERYLAFKDSLLRARNLSQAAMDEFLRRSGEESEEYLTFTERVSKLVDSLVIVENIRLEADSPGPADSLGTATDSGATQQDHSAGKASG